MSSPPPAIDQSLNFVSRPASAVKSLKQTAYTGLAAIVGWLLYVAFFKEPITEIDLPVGLIVGIATVGIIEILASRTRTTISIRNNRVTIHVGSMVTGNFLLTDIAEFEPSALLPNNVVSNPIKVSKVTTHSNLIFYIHTGSLAADDKATLERILSSHAKEP